MQQASCNGEEQDWWGVAEEAVDREGTISDSRRSHVDLRSARYQHLEDVIHVSENMVNLGIHNRKQVPSDRVRYEVGPKS